MSPIPSAIAHAPLAEAYRACIKARESGDSDAAEAVNAIINQRSSHAACKLALLAIGMNDLDLGDFISRIDETVRPGPQLYAIGRVDPAEEADEVDSAEDAAEREIARVQHNIMSSEMRRRRRARQDISDSDVYVPTRHELIHALRDVSAWIEGPEFHEPTLKAVAAAEGLVREVMDTGVTGAEALHEVFQRVDELPSLIEGDDPAVPWVRDGLVLELMVSEMGFAGREPIVLDGETRAAAHRCRHLYSEFDRQHPWDGLRDWRIDLDAPTIASTVAQADLADQYWTNRRLPADELNRYVAPPRREEPNRPSPHGQIVSEAEARQRAADAGGITLPMLYPLPVPRSLRKQAAEQVWTDGIPPLPSSAIGWSLYGGVGDFRAHGRVFPHPGNLFVSITLSESQILSIGRMRKEKMPNGTVRHIEVDKEHEELLDELQVQAENECSTGDNSRRLRDLLISRGFMAVARYDYLYRDTPVPQELVILDPSPEHLLVIRESFPSFVVRDYPAEPRRRSSR